MVFNIPLFLSEFYLVYKKIIIKNKYTKATLDKNEDLIYSNKIHSINMKANLKLRFIMLN